MKYFILSFFCLLLYTQSGAQEYVTNLAHWDMRDGLSHRQVNCICKDKSGFIWAGTRNGLNRFDGYHFISYTKEVNGLPFDCITRIIEDENGSLWLKGEGVPNNLIIFDPIAGTFISFRAKTGYKGDLNFMYLDKMSDGSLFIGDRKNDIYFIWSVKAGLREIKFLFTRNINIVARDNNTLWVKAAEDSVFYVTDASGRIIKQVVLPFSFREIHTRMFGSGDYINSLDVQRTCYVSSDLKVTDLTNALPVREGSNDYLFATGVDDIVCRQGKLCIPSKGIIRDFIKEGNPTFKNILRAALVDDGHIWLGNDFGLYLISITRNRFKQYFYDSSHTLYHNSYRGITVRDGVLYANNESNGLYVADVKTTRKLAFSLAHYDPTVALYYGLTKTNDNGIIGSYRNSVFYIDAKNSPNDLFKRDMLCWKIFETGPGQYLLGTDAGLVWLDAKKNEFKPFTQYGKFSQLASDNVLDIIPDIAGGIWICSNTGLYAYISDKGITARYSSADTGVYYLPAHNIQHLYRDKDGIYWLATTTGLIKWDKNKNQYKVYNTGNGLSNNTIYAVYSDNYGRLWMSSDYGIMEMDKKNEIVKAYFTNDGITYNEFNRISHYCDDSGNIYFGSLNGITAFNPRDFQQDKQTQEAPLVVTSCQQFNGSTNKQEDKLPSLIKNGQITLQPNDKYFTLEFALLNYDNPEYTNYYWKIDGIDTSWNIQKDRVLRFTRIPYGRKTLHIKALASNGKWSKNELRIHLVIIPPIYLRWWFIATCIILLFFIIISWYKIRTRQLKKDNEKLDRIIKEKTKDLEEKTHDLQVSLEQKNVLMKEIHHRVKNNLQVISSLLQIQAKSIEDENAKNALLEGRNRILSIAVIHQKLYQKDNLDNLELNRLASDLFIQVSGLFPDIQVGFANNIPETNINIDVAVPLGLILNELITNSFKYAFDNTAEPVISVALEYQKNGYLLRYADNGKGLNENVDIEELQSLGLRLIYGLASQLNGHVKYEYSHGATFLIFFQLRAENRTD